MATKTVSERVKEVISQQLGINVKGINVEHHLVDDLNADSLDTVELVMAIENEFGIEIPDEEAEKLLTVQEIIEKVLAEKPELAWKTWKRKKPLACEGFLFIKINFYKYYKNCVIFYFKYYIYGFNINIFLWIKKIY